MNKVLAYCGFLQDTALSLPATGVNGAAVHTLREAELCFLWSEVEWPFQPRAMQQNAVQFHHVIAHMFDQGAVFPFRLLTMFDDQPSLAALVARHQGDFMADLERIRGFVQMECVLYLQGVQPKTETARSVEQYVASLRTALASVSPEVRTREIKAGSRIFALVGRGREHDFHACVGTVAVPERFSRRTSGPRPVSEFLSAPAKAPNAVEAQ